MIRGRSCPVLAAVLFCATALVPENAVGQLDDLLSSLLSGGKEGRIRSVSVASQAGDRVVLSVRYSDVRNPAHLRLTARVLESKLKELDDFEVSSAEVIGAEGAAEVTVAYRGSTRVDSAMVEARLVREDGRAVAVQLAPVVRRWNGSGSEVAGDDPPADSSTEEAGPVSTSDSTGGLPTSSSGPPPQREVLLHPTPLPGTPAVAGPAPPEPASPSPPPPATGPAPIDRGGGRRPVAPGTIGMVGTMVTASPMLLQVAAKIDLYAVASGAVWSNGVERLNFNGSPAEASGFARALGRARLADGREYDNVLQTHPRWANEGRIEGAFQLTVPATAQSISFGLGFLPGADGSDGVRFQIVCESEGATTLWLDEAVGPGTVVQRQVAVPAGVRGRAVRLRLITLAGPSSGRDWAVWIAPRVD